MSILGPCKILHPYLVASKGYPDEFRNEIEIKNLKRINLKNNEFIFHAGTKFLNDQILSNGGRVLNFVIRTKEFKEGRNEIFKLIDQLDWKDGFFRKDIGHKVID
mgnify:CR=1 FL=1